MDSTNPNSNTNSTRPSRPPRPHSLSLPTAVPFPSDASHISSQLGLPDPFTRNRTSLLSRIHSDTSPATRFHTSSATGHTHRHHSNAADEPRTHPLHRASTAALDVSRPAPRRTHSLQQQQQQQHPSASVNGESQGLSSGPRAAIAAERKRRLEAIATSPARRTGSGVVEMQRGERDGGLGSGRGQARLFQGPGPGSGSEVGSAIDSAGAGEGMGVGDGERRRESEIRVPRWQPDEEVSKCPVCGVGFTFWFRKHHCRYVVGFLFYFGLRDLILLAGFPTNSLWIFYCISSSEKTSRSIIVIFPVVCFLVDIRCLSIRYATSAQTHIPKVNRRCISLTILSS